MSKKQEEILAEMLQKAEALPGKITKQFNVCGTPNCKCKDKENPQKHGPYYYLSFTFKKKGRTMAIPEELVEEVQKKNENFKKMKLLLEDLAEVSIENLKAEILEIREAKKSCQ